MAFEPNKLTFDACVERIRTAVEKSGVSAPKDKILTSKSTGVAKATEALQTHNIPAGFHKWQLPVYLASPSQFFVSVGTPGTKVAEHSHDEGDGLRYIVSGSIIHDGVELAAGDWMFIPRGTKYSIEVGRLGATMFYCYSCCCA